MLKLPDGYADYIYPVRFKDEGGRIVNAYINVLPRDIDHHREECLRSNYADMWSIVTRSNSALIKYKTRLEDGWVLGNCFQQSLYNGHKVMGVLSFRRVVSRNQ